MMLYGKYSLEPHEGADPGLRGAATGGLPSTPPGAGRCGRQFRCAPNAAGACVWIAVRH